MSFLNSLSISASALTAEKFRSDIILQNMANISTTRTAEGTAYRRKQVVFEERRMNFSEMLDESSAMASGGGVRVREVVENQSDLTPVYDPTHPHADEEGYVYMPNVNRAEEMVDLMAASRAYEANVTAVNVAKSMIMKAMDIGRS